MRKRNLEFERGTFNVPMNLQLFADGGAEGGDPADGGNANGSGGDQDPQGKQPSVDELLVQLSEERARNAQLQNEKNTASTEAANYKKQLRAKMSAEDLAAAAKAEADAQKDARIKELEAKIQIRDYTERCMDADIGMDKVTAKEFAEALAGNDVEKAFKALGNHIKAKKTAWEQEFYAGRDDIRGGNGGEKTSLALEKAKKMTSSRSGEVNQDVLKHYV